MKHLESCLQMDMNQDVTRFAFESVVEHEHRAKIKLAIENDCDPCYGFWVVHRRTDNIFLGWVYLKPFESELTMLELGYRFRHEYWGNGYAREAAAKLLSITFSKEEERLVCAITNSENFRSIKLLESLGFISKKIMLAYGGIGVHYILSNEKMAIKNKVQ